MLGGFGVLTNRPDKNPARIEAWPPTLPLEIALRVQTAPAIFKDYGYGRVDYERLCADPAFREAVAKCATDLAQGGGQLSFKMKASLMADHLLDKAYELTIAPYSVVPPAVQASMINKVVDWAGLDASKDQGNKQGAANNGNQLQIVINI